MSRRLYPPVSAFTWKGKALLTLIRIVGLLCRPFYSPQRPRKDFEENPSYFSFADVLYFGCKYYLNPPEKAENDTLETYFNTMRFDFPEPNTLEPERLSLSTGGDLMPYDWLTEENTRHLWDDIGDWFFGSDLVFANLETPVHRGRPESAVPEVMLNHMHFNASENLFRIFNGNGKYRGFDILSTANNHSFDMGEEGVIETLRFLREKDILAVGTAANPEEKDLITVIEKKGMRIAFLAYTYCLNHLELPKGKEYLANTARLNLPDADLSPLRDLVSKAREVADLVVLALHNGNAYQAYPSQHTVNNVHRLFDECGPDLILGSHPHNPQPIEQYAFVCPYSGKKKKGIAVYSQGDFVAYDIFTWCHFHLALRFELARTKEGGVVVAGMEVLPHYMHAGEGPGKFDFRFIPLRDLVSREKQFNTKALKKSREILRFWKQHLAPSLSPYEV